MLLLLFLGSLFLLPFAALDKFAGVVDKVDDLTVRRVANNLYVPDALQMLPELRDVPPLRLVELNMSLFLSILFVQRLQVFGLTRVLGLQHLHKLPLQLLRVLLDMLCGVIRELLYPSMVRGRVQMAVESVLIAALFAAEFAEILESS